MTEETNQKPVKAEESGMATTRWVLIGARVVSSIFRPVFYPTVGVFVMLVLVTTCPMHERTLHLLMKMAPWLVGAIFLLTVCLPALLIYFYRRFNHWPSYVLRHRANRTVPYAIFAGSYLLCMYVVGNMFVPFLRMIPSLRCAISDPFTYTDAISHLVMPRCVVSLIFTALIVQCICMFVNLFWKVSMHSAGSGAIIGAIAAYSEFFGFYPVWWLAGAILLSGCVMSSRMILRQHTLAQVLTGTLIGVACALVSVQHLLISSFR